MATFTVNGRTVRAEQNQKLLRFLRDTLRLTSVKDGCSEGACGACTVLVDGRATRACVVWTEKLEGKSVVTAEGLSDFEKQAYIYAFGAAGAAVPPSQASRLRKSPNSSSSAAARGSGHPQRMAHPPGTQS